MSINGIDDVVIRMATNDDKDKVVALVSGVLSEFGMQLDPGATDADLNNIEEGYLKSGGIFEIVEDREGNLLGTVGLFPLYEGTCELRKMYFAPQARGLGLGKHVLKRAVNHARELGFRQIVLETAGVLKQAIRLYTRFGFVPVKSDHLSARCDQAYMLDLTGR